MDKIMRLRSYYKQISDIYFEQNELIVLANCITQIKPEKLTGKMGIADIKYLGIGYYEVKIELRFSTDFGFYKNTAEILSVTDLRVLAIIDRHNYTDYNDNYQKATDFYDYLYRKNSVTQKENASYDYKKLFCYIHDLLLHGLSAAVDIFFDDLTHEKLPPKSISYMADQLADLLLTPNKIVLPKKA